MVKKTNSYIPYIDMLEATYEEIERSASMIRRDIAMRGDVNLRALAVLWSSLCQSIELQSYQKPVFDEFQKDCHSLLHSAFEKNAPTEQEFGRDLKALLDRCEAQLRVCQLRNQLDVLKQKTSHHTPDL